MTGTTWPQDQTTTSLDRLHDLALPPEVSGWPTAPGWHVLCFMVASIGAIILVRLLVSYRANAYRRAALRELETLQEPTEIAELLRRTALAIHPRPAVAKLTGSAWVHWLEAHGSDPMSEPVKSGLIQGVYRATDKLTEVEPLKSYAAQWIMEHRLSSSEKDLLT